MVETNTYKVSQTTILLFVFCLTRSLNDVGATPMRLRRRVAQCSNTNNGPGESPEDESETLSVTLSKRFAKRAVIASELSFVSFDDDISSNNKVRKYRKIYDEFNAWEDLNDAHLLVKQDGVCYGVFRGTIQPSLTDNVQNLYRKNEQVAGTNCEVRKGFHQAYFTSYVQQFRRKLVKCVKSCAQSSSKSGENCPLVLSGQSQGASIAIVASIDLVEYKPTTMAFGTLKTVTNLGEGCTDIDSQRIYNFINASGGVYDDAPYGFGDIGHHVGHTILLDEGNALAYTGMNDNTARGPTARKIHAVELYRTRMQELVDYNSGCFPRTVTQWDNGHWCTLSDECKSKHCSPDNICTPKPSKRNGRNKKGSSNKQVMLRTSGSPCDKDSVCESGTCFRTSCALANGKLGMGASCKDNKDCDTGRCDASGNSRSDPRVCSPLRDVGSFCDQNS